MKILTKVLKSEKKLYHEPDISFGEAGNKEAPP